MAGTSELVAAAARRLSAPGVEGGATLGTNRAFFQGLFQSPQASPSPVGVGSLYQDARKVQMPEGQGE